MGYVYHGMFMTVFYVRVKITSLFERLLRSKEFRVDRYVRNHILIKCFFNNMNVIYEKSCMLNIFKLNIHTRIEIVYDRCAFGLLYPLIKEV